MNLAKKIKQKLSKTLRLNLRYLKIIRFLHPQYHLFISFTYLFIIYCFFNVDSYRATTVYN